MTDFSLPRPTAKAKGTVRDTIRSQLQVLHGIILHDIKSRFFGNGLGYIVTIIWPGAHIALIVIAHAVVHHEMAYGDSPLLYASTGVLCYISWSYIARFTMRAVSQNRSFLQYPVVKLLDLIIGRQALEIVTCTIITITMIIILTLCQAHPMPNHPADAAFALLSAVFLGIGFGVLNGVIVAIFPLWNLLYILVILGGYFTCGVIINPEQMPNNIGDMMSWNPLLHSVEWMRSAYYDDYPTRLLNKVYPFYVGASTLMLGLIGERVVRNIA